jgi:hypothetical protein
VGGGDITVLEVKKVGSFTAFVLQAGDAGALSAWLVKNGLVSTPEADAWLSHYVKLGFYYVAMRYDPPRNGGDSTASQVMRFSFDTPAPYYPYLEPKRAEGAPAAPRMMDLWLVSDATWVPVAARDGDPAPRWVRPLVAGKVYSGQWTASRLQTLLGPDRAILPASAGLVVQRFADQKTSRDGFGDIVFVPAHPTSGDATDADLAPFAALVDPGLEARP